MIEAIVGSEGAERVLLFLTARGSGHPREIATCWSLDVSTVQNHLLRMERDGLLVSRKVGRTRVFEFIPRYLFVDEIKVLLTKALTQLPTDVLDRLTLQRARPRRARKPL
ncbi:winged helix-turn-helix transcriptional regulator [Parahaliea aestuarii]|uniref:Winged helix-turn-helix transcriptional regulator n=1 Tax=Parahaliea aestuarii TaxID=1852021 RepID=A0A5C8ZXT6_9GAMM|nr:winged helix-turn-helix transcriptional regulator [Parahaliea aestuarii]